MTSMGQKKSRGSTYPKLEKMDQKYTKILQTLCMMSACVCVWEGERGEWNSSFQCFDLGEHYKL